MNLRRCSKDQAFKQDLLDYAVPLGDTHYISKLTLPHSFESLVFSSDEHDSDTSDGYGAIVDKLDLYTLFKQYSTTTLRYIDNVHQKGLHKYQLFSWLVDPVNIDGTTELCLKAAIRHITAHDIGCILYPEGLPHLHHYIYRLGIAAVSRLRELEYHQHSNFKKVECKEHFISRYTEYTQYDMWYQFILPKNLVALKIGQLNSSSVPFTFTNKFSMFMYIHDRYVKSRTAPNNDIYISVDKIDSHLAIQIMSYLCTGFFYGCDYIHKTKTV